jgi:hypothetical protein
MCEDWGRTGCAGGGGSLILFLAPIWAIGLLLMPALALFISNYLFRTLLKTSKPVNLPQLLFAIPIGYLLVKGWFKVGWYGSGLLGWLGL